MGSLAPAAHTTVRSQRSEGKAVTHAIGRKGAEVLR